jgi:predicted neutral ceramidase superfamily lipid hydrolase
MKENENTSLSLALLTSLFFAACTYALLNITGFTELGPLYEGISYSLSIITFFILIILQFDIRTLKNKQTIARIIGISLLIFYIANRFNPMQVESINSLINSKLSIFLVYFCIRIFSVFLSISISKNLNRNHLTWGTGGFVAPIIVLPILSLLKVKKIVADNII